MAGAYDPTMKLSKAFQSTSSQLGGAAVKAMSVKRVNNWHSLARLKKSGAVSQDQVNAFDEINLVVSAISQPGYLRICEPERATIGRRYDSERRNLSMFDQLYKQWINDIGTDAKMIIEMIESVKPLTSCALKHGMRWSTARAKLIAGLDIWMELRAANEAD